MRESPDTRGEDLGRILAASRAGDSVAADRVFAIVYEELRNLAKRLLAAQKRGQTLQPTILVHEAYLKLRAETQLDGQDRVHFFALASRVMRQVLVDHARRKAADRRGGGRERITLDSGAFATPAADVDLLDLQEALEGLVQLDERQARIVEMRYFGGLEMEEIAGLVGLSTRQVEREWRAARAWIGRRLQRGEPT